jgi:hypothetical protein
MSKVMQSARGASAFTLADPFFCGDEAGPAALHTDEAPAHGWDRLIDELLRIRNLSDDWDGEGSEAPDPALVDGAITLAQTLQAGGDSPAERVLASVNGTIYFEWHTPLGYREVEVTSPLDAESRFVRTGSNEVEVVRLSRRS